mmetsp:Transcript_12381/g.14418  ORF Transcript_12381/g.14418 Transcript_12381/m.14418 type:complete len:108 (+) Transcript_12381:1296-1619(+)
MNHKHMKKKITIMAPCPRSAGATVKRTDTISKVIATTAKTKYSSPLHSDVFSMQLEDAAASSTIEPTKAITSPKLAWTRWLLGKFKLHAKLTLSTCSILCFGYKCRR